MNKDMIKILQSVVVVVNHVVLIWKAAQDTFDMKKYPVVQVKIIGILVVFLVCICVFIIFYIKAGNQCSQLLIFKIYLIWFNRSKLRLL